MHEEVGRGQPELPKWAVGRDPLTTRTPPGRVRGPERVVVERSWADQYAAALSAQFGFELPIGDLEIRGIPRDDLPRNQDGQHLCPPGAEHLDAYFDRAARFAERVRLARRGTTRAFDWIADFYHTMANARPFPFTNNSLFMTQANYLLRLHGHEGLSHGYLDHLAQRTTPAQFRLIFRAALRGELPRPEALGILAGDY
jgi:hypothetical protein